MARYVAGMTRPLHATIATLTVLALAGCGTDDQAAAPTSQPTASEAAPQGAPPAPDAATQKAYLAALRKIDPNIVGDKEPKALVDRGRDQCASIAEWPNDKAKLISITNQRFTSPDHPDGFGKAKAEKILAAVRTYICP